MQVQDNRLSSLREYFNHALRNSIYQKEELRSLFSILAQEILDLSSSQVMLAQDTRLTESQILKGLNTIKSLKRGRPIQYIIGHTEFMDLKLKCDDRALIPRPETEELILWIQEIEKNPRSILDIGTGTGCIALALKNTFKDTKVLALDAEEQALALARENAELTGLDIELIQEDILNPKVEYPRLDIIVSNPPYVLEKEKTSMRTNVLEHEPHSALFVSDEDPLLFYNHILAFATSHLNPSGSIYFEINELYASEIKSSALEHGFRSVEIKQDIHGKDRMMRIRFN